MAGEPIFSPLRQIADELRAQAIFVTRRTGACGNVRGSAEAAASFTTDLDEAAIAPRQVRSRRRRRKHPPSGPGVKWRRPMSAKAARRAFIRKHNRRMKARALREQRTEG